MTRFTAPGDWTAHPALRVLALAWVPLAAQSAYAASAWAVWLVVAAVANRLSARSAQPLTAALALRDLPAPNHPFARRRADAAPQKNQAPERSAPLLKAHHDALAGLTTPQQLSDTGEPWAQDLRARGQSLCVLHVGLDGFEPVTERYGHEAGDQVLMQVAKRLRHLARDEDRVMRFDGAEFVLLLSCPANEGQAFSCAMASRIVTELQRPLAYRTVSNLRIGCSVGSALWPLNGSSLGEVLRHAEDALAGARHSGRGQARQYAGSDDEPAAA